MFSIAFSSLFGQDAVNRGPAYAESSRNRARRLTAGMHAPCQPDLSFAECLWTTNCLPTRDEPHGPQRNAPDLAPTQVRQD
jgi:hypothetical protein